MDGQGEFVTGPSLSRSPDRIAGMFDAIAGRYDLLNHLLSAGIDRGWRKRAIAALRLSGRERVLDLCTGTADLAMAARQAPRSAASVVGVDFAEAMLRVGQGKLARARLDRSIALVRGDATAIPLADRSVDAITVAFGIRNVEQPDAACREMHRVLRPRGRIAILEFAIPPNPLMRAIYLWYSRRILPRIGGLVSRHGSAYAYLPASIGAFASPQEFVTILRHAGFLEIDTVPLTFGTVILYTACRDELYSL